jgi:hypothetical protein
MLKILGYLGIAGFGFLLYFLFVFLKLPLHLLKEFINILKLFLFVWYFYFFVKALILFPNLKGVFTKIYIVIAYLISIFGVCSISFLIFGDGSLSLGEYKFVKTCKNYDIVKKFVPWSDIYYRYQDKNYKVIEAKTDIDKKLCI